MGLSLIENIKESILRTKRFVDEHDIYPEFPGIYCFFLSESSELKEFGKGGQVMYIGIAKKKLKERDLKQHFKTGKTGASTLRRSIGAILKEDLRLKAIPRGKSNDTNRIDNYKFDLPEDEELTNWMKANLETGYWVDENGIGYTDLRELEKQLIIKLKPTLDLDNRTRRYNPLAEKLTCLRNICKLEVCSYIEKFETK